MYRIPEWVREKRDMLRRRFLWQETKEGRRKYALVN
jgi:hypothetical protein